MQNVQESFRCFLDRNGEVYKLGNFFVSSALGRLFNRHPELVSGAHINSLNAEFSKILELGKRL